MTRRYVMRKSVLTLLRKINGSARCHACEENVEIGQQVVSKIANHHTKVYHEKCYEGLFLDV